MNTKELVNCITKVIVAVFDNEDSFIEAVCADTFSSNFMDDVLCIEELHLGGYNSKIVFYTYTGLVVKYLLTEDIIEWYNTLS